MIWRDALTLLVDAVRLSFADDSVRFDLFRLSEGRHTQIRRVLFVPVSGELTPRRAPPGQLDRPLYIASVSMVCAVRGKDLEDTMQTWARLLQAFDAALPASRNAQLGAFEFLTQDRSAQLGFGGQEIIAQRVALNMAVPAEPITLATLDELDFTYDIEAITVEPDYT